MMRGGSREMQGVTGRWGKYWGEMGEEGVRSKKRSRGTETGYRNSYRGIEEDIGIVV